MSVILTDVSCRRASAIEQIALIPGSFGGAGDGRARLAFALWWLQVAVSGGKRFGIAFGAAAIVTLWLLDLLAVRVWEGLALFLVELSNSLLCAGLNKVAQAALEILYLPTALVGLDGPLDLISQCRVFLAGSR